MQITVIAVGRLKESYLKEGAGEYLKRLSSYAKVRVVEIADQMLAENASAAQKEKVLHLEGEGILQSIPPQSFVIALDISGELLYSEQLADLMEKTALSGNSSFVFIIGGSVGLSPDVLARADKRVSFGRMTYPHQLMRMILLEQIYRTFRINRGEPYHK